MAQDPEAHTQLVRLLRNEQLLHASLNELRDAIDENFDSLVDGIVAEAAASDDVMDRETALSFVRLRAGQLQGLLSDEQKARLLDAASGKIEAW